MGDGNICGTESCPPDKVLAIATHVVDEKGNRRPLYSKARIAKAKLWYHIRPLRRYILAALRRLNKKKYAI